MPGKIEIFDFDAALAEGAALRKQEREQFIQVVSFVAQNKMGGFAEGVAHITPASQALEKADLHYQLTRRACIQKGSKDLLRQHDLSEEERPLIVAVKKLNRLLNYLPKIARQLEEEQARKPQPDVHEMADLEGGYVKTTQEIEGLLQDIHLAHGSSGLNEIQVSQSSSTLFSVKGNGASQPTLTPAIEASRQSYASFAISTIAMGGARLFLAVMSKVRGVGSTISQSLRGAWDALPGFSLGRKTDVAVLPYVSAALHKRVCSDWSDTGGIIPTEVDFSNRPGM